MIIIIELLLMVVMCLLRQQVMLLIRYLNRLRWKITVICWYMLRMSNKLVVLMESRELH